MPNFKPSLPETGPSVLTIEVKCPVPTLNALLKLSHWGRHSLKKKIQADLLSVLLAEDASLRTKMHLSGNTFWMRSVLRELSPATRLADWITRSDRKKSHQKPMRER